METIWSAFKVFPVRVEAVGRMLLGQHPNSTRGYRMCFECRAGTLEAETWICMPVLPPTSYATYTFADVITREAWFSRR